jgi:hypothetical protein
MKYALLVARVLRRGASALGGPADEKIDHDRVKLDHDRDTADLAA